MDIQREREAFEAIPEIKDKITSYKMDFVNGSYDSLFSHINAWMDGAWFLFQEKAKAQAVPEGFVLLKNDSKTIVAIEQMVEQQVEASGMDSRCLERLDGEKILQAAIEAQEST